jgi:hypothetical protein
MQQDLTVANMVLNEEQAVELTLKVTGQLFWPVSSFMQSLVHHRTAKVHRKLPIGLGVLTELARRLGHGIMLIIGQRCCNNLVVSMSCDYSQSLPHPKER